MEFISQLVILTEFVHRDIKGFQFGAAAQEICRNILHAVLAHIKQLNLRQTKRCAQLSDTVSEKKRKNRLYNSADDVCGSTIRLFDVKLSISLKTLPFHIKLLQRMQVAAQLERECGDFVE